MNQKAERLFFIIALLIQIPGFGCFANSSDTIPAKHNVTLPEAHIGNLEIDTRLLDSYLPLPENIRKFYFEARSVLVENPNTDFTDEQIIESALANNISLMGGPMLGQITESSVSIWLRAANKNPKQIEVTSAAGSFNKTYNINSVKPGKSQRVAIGGLQPGTKYIYSITEDSKTIAKGNFTTTPAKNSKGKFSITFGSCFHKIGLHNPNLVQQILKREPGAMLLLGDIAVDDRENNINMHRSDYLLRDLSLAWKDLAANVPLYTSWDDHDYLNNDLSGIPEGFTEKDRQNLRTVWHENWNNPELEKEGIYFSQRIGPAEIIMLDTRSLRDVGKRGEYGSYLGAEQLNWLKEILKKSEAPFKILSSGTMWSDYITPGKDSWGTWDTIAREEIFKFIEEENIKGVLFISGDRHGARGFRIPRPSGFDFYEFEVATLGGVPGPPAMAKDTSHQLFGYSGKDFVAFGEFTFDTNTKSPEITFRLISQKGKVLEEHILPYHLLDPKNP